MRGNLARAPWGRIAAACIAVLAAACDQTSIDATQVAAGSATPLPPRLAVPPAVGPGATARIGADGGVAMSPDGRLRLTVPAGALPADTDIRITPLAPGALQFGVVDLSSDLAYDLQPAGLQFAEPVELVLRTDDTASFNGGQVTTPVLFAGTLSDGVLEPLENNGTAVDAASGQVFLTGQLRHFSVLTVSREVKLEAVARFDTAVEGANGISTSVFGSRALGTILGNATFAIPTQSELDQPHVSTASGTSNAATTAGVFRGIYSESFRGSRARDARDTRDARRPDSAVFDISDPFMNLPGIPALLTDTSPPRLQASGNSVCIDTGKVFVDVFFELELDTSAVLAQARDEIRAFAETISPEDAFPQPGSGRQIAAGDLRRAADGNLLLVERLFNFLQRRVNDDSNTNRFQLRVNGVEINCVASDLNPLGDLDGDGLANQTEIELGTGVRNPDSDGDGKNDGDEFFGNGDTDATRVATDPLDADTDDDGFADGRDTAPRNPGEGAPSGGGVIIPDGAIPRGTTQSLPAELSNTRLDDFTVLNLSPPPAGDGPSKLSAGGFANFGSGLIGLFASGDGEISGVNLLDGSVVFQQSEGLAFTPLGVLAITRPPGGPESDASIIPYGIAADEPPINGALFINWDRPLGSTFAFRARRAISRTVFDATLIDNRLVGDRALLATDNNVFIVRYDERSANDGYEPGLALSTGGPVLSAFARNDSGPYLLLQDIEGEGGVLRIGPGVLETLATTGPNPRKLRCLGDLCVASHNGELDVASSGITWFEWDGESREIPRFRWRESAGGHGRDRPRDATRRQRGCRGHRLQYQHRVRG